MLDTSHLREYTDLRRSGRSSRNPGLRIVALEAELLWFPLLDPLLFRSAGSARIASPTLLRALRAAKVPIPGYYSLEIVVER